MVSLVGIIAYSIVQLVLMLGTGVVPDEMWFFNTSVEVAHLFQQQGVLVALATYPNHLGYGAGYWLGYGAVTWLLDYGVLILRLVAWVAFTAIPLLLWYRGRQLASPSQWLAVGLWLAMPVAWWTGKVTGPDIFVVSLCALGLTLVLAAKISWRFWLGWLILGLALGLKLNALPIVLFAVIVTQTKLVSLLKVAGLMLLGGILMNPFMLREPTLFFSSLQQVTTPATYTWLAFSQLLWNRVWTWDDLFSGGLFQVGLNLVSFSLWLVWLYLNRLPKKFWLAGGAAIFVALVMFIQNGTFYGWYWFPILLIIPWMTLSVTATQHHYSNWLAVSIILISLITTVPLVYQSYQIKLTRWQTLPHTLYLNL